MIALAFRLRSAVSVGNMILGVREKWVRPRISRGRNAPMKGELTE